MCDECKPDRVLRGFIPALNRWVDCPNQGCRSGINLGQEPYALCLLTASVADVIIHLNDKCLWTREQIADWLDSLDLDLSFPSEPPRPLV